MVQMLAGMERALLTTALDTCTGVAREPVRRLEVLSGMAGRRRSWSLEQKLAIVAEAEHCDNMTALARRHDIRTSLLYTWRRELRYAAEAARQPPAPEAPMFVPALIAEPTPPPKAVASSRRRRRRAAAAVELEIDGVAVRIGHGTDRETIAAVIAALKLQG